jgi:CHAT domain-containing protein
LPPELKDKEESLVKTISSLRKQRQELSRDKMPETFALLVTEIQKAEEELKAFVEMLWACHSTYAAARYPRPIAVKDASLNPEEYILVFDVLGEGVSVHLLRGKGVERSVFVPWDAKDITKQVSAFRKGFEQARLKEFDPDLGAALYDLLLRQILERVPRGAALTIIPDGDLALLPFEALVAEGKAHWKKGNRGDVPEGVTYLGDLFEINYHHSLTALTISRTIGKINDRGVQFLVVADPVFDMNEDRAQAVGAIQIAQQDRDYYFNLMTTIEESGTRRFRFERLPETGRLARNLKEIYGNGVDMLTGLEATKQHLMTRVAPRLEQYGWIVFATHGLASERVPGIGEPFLALTMVPTGTDGFLRMSDVMGLKMKADVVALTACQTGIGTQVSGEGILSMGRSFQYAGAASVLMSLWSVAEESSVILVEEFFRQVKLGKPKLEALKAARNSIRQQGFEHPFFWAAFILVGEVN